MEQKSIYGGIEQQHPCSKTKNAQIAALAKALIDVDHAEEAQNYFLTDTFPVPYFKIAQSFQGGAPDDTDIDYLIIHVCDAEYTVCSRYLHEHFADANEAALLIKRLFTGEYAEVAIVFTNKTAGFFMANTGTRKRMWIFSPTTHKPL